MVEQDVINKRKVCAKFLGSINPWLPVKPGIDVLNYYIDKHKKLGWCVNPKVSTHSSPQYTIAII